MLLLPLLSLSVALRSPSLSVALRLHLLSRLIDNFLAQNAIYLAFVGSLYFLCN